jgi:hypothetical protein
LQRVRRGDVFIELRDGYGRLLAEIPLQQVVGPGRTGVILERAQELLDRIALVRIGIAPSAWRQHGRNTAATAERPIRTACPSRRACRFLSASPRLRGRLTTSMAAENARTAPYRRLMDIDEHPAPLPSTISGNGRRDARTHHLIATILP